MDASGSSARGPTIVPHVGYRDARSQKQIATYLVHAIDNAECNRRNLERWNGYLAAQWYEQEAVQKFHVIDTTASGTRPLRLHRKLDPMCGQAVTRGYAPVGNGQRLPSVA